MSKLPRPRSDGATFPLAFTTPICCIIALALLDCRQYFHFYTQREHPSDVFKMEKNGTLLREPVLMQQNGVNQISSLEILAHNNNSSVTKKKNISGIQHTTESVKKNISGIQHTTESVTYTIEVKNNDTIVHEALLMHRDSTLKQQFNSLSMSINSNSRNRPVKFVPYPHKTLGSGTDMQCHWETRTVSDYSKELEYDFTQRAAFAEGVCIPPKLNTSIHVYSTDEARACLKSKHVIISGDSYMKQLYIGLADILMSKHLNNNKEIIGSVERNKTTGMTQKWLDKQHEKDSSFPIVQYGCEDACYGHTKPFSRLCSDCINEYTKNNETVAIVGAGIHMGYGQAKEINNFLQLAKKTIFVSMPSYFDKKANRLRNIYEKLLPNLAPQNPQHPFLDVYQMTHSCVAQNCSYDGSHRSRYVNRWKAQLLLNTLCDVNA